MDGTASARTRFYGFLMNSDQWKVSRGSSFKIPHSFLEPIQTALYSLVVTCRLIEILLRHSLQPESADQFTSSSSCVVSDHHLLEPWIDQTHTIFDPSS